MKTMKIVAFPSSGIELSKVVTSLRMLGIALILLRGLTTLRILKGLKFNLNLIRSTTLNKVINYFLPCNNNDKIDSIPPVPHISVLMKDESLSPDL